MSSHRFPKWLTAERFTIDYDPTAPGRWAVSLLDERGPTRGYGRSIAVAAKRALVARASSPPLGRARPVASLPAANREKRS